MTSTGDDDFDSLDLDERHPGKGEARNLVGDDIDFDDSEESADDDSAEDLDEDEFDDEDDDDDLEDAEDEDIDLTVAVYREDGVAIARTLDRDSANDLEEVIAQLRRMPGDGGAVGFVSLAEEVFVIVRVRGAVVQVLLSDAGAAGDWPIARDVADFLGVDEIPDPDDDPTPLGDLGLLADQGLSAFDLENLCTDLDEASDEQVLVIADRIRVGPQVRRLVEAEFR